MMKRQCLTLAAMLILSHVVFCNEKKVLRPDRKVVLTSVERQDKDNRPYRIEGHTSGAKIALYYKLACGTGAATLEVGHTYDAAEVESEGNKILVFWYENLDPRTNAFGVGCDVESVKDH